MARVTLRILGDCVIELGDRQVTPSSSYLFGLLLHLALERGRAVSRSALGEFLFPRCTNLQRRRRLRQLLYRAKELGAPLRASRWIIELPSAEAEGPLDAFMAMARAQRARISHEALTILPMYEPTISHAFAEWVERTQRSLGSTILSTLLDDFRIARKECRWKDVVCVGRTLRQLDARNEDTVLGLSEALLMLGHKDEALAELDAFTRKTVGSGPSAALRRIRSRIERASPPISSSETTLRGRQEHLASLARVWSTAVSKHPRLCVLLGAPGIGKTRLANEFGTRVVLSGGQCLTYECAPSDAELPFGAFAQLVPQLRALRGSLGASPELRSYLDLLSVTDRRTVVLDPASLEAIRAGISSAFVDLVDAVCVERPLLVVIDDAHLLDAASSSVFASLCDRRSRSALMVLCCVRGGDMRSLPILSRTSPVAYSLRPLSAADSRSLTEELLSDRVHDADHLDWILTQAAGNPFYLQSLARQESHGAEASSPPVDICCLATSSYCSLDNQARMLLEACMCLGELATLPRVQQVAGFDDETLAASLRQLEHGGLITCARGELRLQHALLEQALRSLVPSSVAALVHARAARFLKARRVRRGRSSRRA